MGYLRRAGRGRVVDGRIATWSVAEGSRGRRWRWTMATGEGRLEHTGLLELDAARRFARLELESAVGMLTLHPGEDRLSLHGNVVRIDRVDPVMVPWKADSGLWMAMDPFASALLGEGAQLIEVAPDLTVTSRDRIGHRAVPALDDRGIPQLLDPDEWPLEV